MRGEYSIPLDVSAGMAGSSPHAWGILLAGDAGQIGHRFIPTCVGNTRQVLVQTRQGYGSSPHAWGIRFHVQPRLKGYRFIPTCVGNTAHGADGRGPDPVHPHMRGEYARKAGASSSTRGSSPHAWGIPCGRSNNGGRDRFIPTCVGNTWLGFGAYDTPAVHPHMRGEYQRLDLEPPCARGSSPHAWGIHNTWNIIREDERFIPTCVGNTRGVPCPMSMGPVHPHMRGEYYWRRQYPMPEDGSSPHAWGIHSTPVF